MQARNYKTIQQILYRMNRLCVNATLGQLFFSLKRNKVNRTPGNFFLRFFKLENIDYFYETAKSENLFLEFADRFELTEKYKSKTESRRPCFM